jgi:hypothetical protein
MVLERLRDDVAQLKELFAPAPAPEGVSEVLIYVPWDRRNPDQLGRQPGSNVILYDPDEQSEAWAPGRS